MLFQLNIKNMALIKELNIEFEEGLNVLTGETGAGKSIIIEAIDLILGGSTATDLIRDGEDRLVVEGLFLLVPQEKELISNLNLDAEIVDGEEDLLIRREINKKGRNKCWINQRLINLSTLQEIGKFLVDLHGQHNHQSLLDSSKHIDLMDNLGGDKIIKYRKELADNYRMWREKSKKLFQLIKDGEENLEKIVIRELEDLNMKKCQFKVSINNYEDDNGIEIEGKKYKIGPKGIDDIEFMISPNIGERLRPLARIVSGGEVSRIMLALKSILSEVDQVPTLIFDEIDSGVGARLGEVIAQKLKALSKKRQVICVTHLPQIACRAGRHFYIEKYVLNNQTGIKLNEMKGEERVKEIARMLDGSQMSEITIQHAQKMLDR